MPLLPLLIGPEMGRGSANSRHGLLQHPGLDLPSHDYPRAISTNRRPDIHRPIFPGGKVP